MNVWPIESDSESKIAIPLFLQATILHTYPNTDSSECVPPVRFGLERLLRPTAEEDAFAAAEPLPPPLDLGFSSGCS